MLRSRPFHSGEADEGSASLEFITAGMILLVPLVYLVLAVAAIQAGALSIEGASRQAARVYVQGTSNSDAEASSRLAAQFALADYGLPTTEATVRISCRPNPTHCLTRRGFVTVQVDAIVPLPFAPAALGAKFPLSVPLRATATQQVSRFRGAE